MMRVGCGWDSHRLVPERPLLLAGVVIPSPLGEQAHSDGDVLLHAVIDALLGAAALPDIGQQFPDTDPAYAGASSLVLLRHALALVRQAGFALENVDSTVILQQPRLAPHVPALRENLAQALLLPVDRVSVKAPTAEGLDSVGRGEAVQAMAVVLLRAADDETTAEGRPL